MLAASVHYLLSFYLHLAVGSVAEAVTSRRLMRIRFSRVNIGASHNDYATKTRPYPADVTGGLQNPCKMAAHCTVVRNSHTNYSNAHQYQSQSDTTYFHLL